MLDAHPSLADRQGQTIVVGIRPEDLDDAAVFTEHPSERRFSADVALVEALGAELVTHLRIDAPAVDAGDPDAEQPVMEGDGTAIVGRFSPRSSVRDGDTAQVTVDTANLHFFDHQTGDSLRA